MKTFKLLTLLLLTVLYSSCDMSTEISNFEGGGTDGCIGSCPSTTSGSTEGSNSNSITGSSAINDGMIAHYPMEMEAADITLYRNDGQIEGNMTNLHGEVQLDGTESWIIAPHRDHLNLQNEFTLSAMINPAKVKTQTILRKGAEVNGENKWPYGLSLSGTGDVIFTVTTNNGADMYQARSTGYDTDVWMQVTGTYRNEEMRLFVNGVLVETLEAKGIVNTNSSPLLIGSRIFGLASSTVEGSIDEVRIYDVALSNDDVEQLYLDLVQ